MPEDSLAGFRTDYSNVEFINADERDFFAQAIIGDQVKAFLQSEAGRFLHGCAKQEVEEAKELLMQLNPFDETDQKKIADVQKNAGAAERFMRWCAEAIIQGDNADTMLRHIEETER